MKRASGNIAGSIAGLALRLLLGGLTAGCGSTVDSVGYDQPGSSGGFRPMMGPVSYPNPFADLGKTDAEIAAKLGRAFDQLFHGEPTTQAIYFLVNGDQAFILDTARGDVRTDALGYGMLVAVQMNKREEFDRLWTYAKAAPLHRHGSDRGYYASFCNTETGALMACADPFGMQQIVMALLFANGRWGSSAAAGGGTNDYAAGAREALDVMLHKEEQNGGVVDGITNMFDRQAGLPFDLPHVSSAGRTRPSVVMPGFYELWGQATTDPFWIKAAGSARALWKAAAHEQTGLLPLASYFDGRPVLGADTFQPEAYRAHLSMVLDYIWFARDPWTAAESERLLQFFSTQGMDLYGISYTLDGRLLDPSRGQGLIAVNGTTAMLTAPSATRSAFIDAVWNMEIPTGATRSFSGLVYLQSLLILSGQFMVY
jgi:oligosaccharide reducing-end xylanase